MPIAQTAAGPIHSGRRYRIAYRDAASDARETTGQWTGLRGLTAGPVGTPAAQETLEIRRRGHPVLWIHPDRFLGLSPPPETNGRRRGRARAAAPDPTPIVTPAGPLVPGRRYVLHLRSGIVNRGVVGRSDDGQLTLRETGRSPGVSGLLLFIELDQVVGQHVVATTAPLFLALPGGLGRTSRVRLDPGETYLLILAGREGLLRARWSGWTVAQRFLGFFAEGHTPRVGPDYRIRATEILNVRRENGQSLAPLLTTPAGDLIADHRYDVYFEIRGALPGHQDHGMIREVHWDPLGVGEDVDAAVFLDEEGTPYEIETEAITAVWDRDETGPATLRLRGGASLVAGAIYEGGVGGALGGALGQYYWEAAPEDPRPGQIALYIPSLRQHRWAVPHEHGRPRIATTLGPPAAAPTSAEPDSIETPGGTIRPYRVHAHVRYGNGSGVLLDVEGQVHAGAEAGHIRIERLHDHVDCAVSDIFRVAPLDIVVTETLLEGAIRREAELAAQARTALVTIPDSTAILIHLRVDLDGLDPVELYASVESLRLRLRALPGPRRVPAALLADDPILGRATFSTIREAQADVSYVLSARFTAISVLTNTDAGAAYRDRGARTLIARLPGLVVSRAAARARLAQERSRQHMDLIDPLPRESQSVGPLPPARRELAF